MEPPARRFSFPERRFEAFWPAGPSFWSLRNTVLGAPEYRFGHPERRFGASGTSFSRNGVSINSGGVKTAFRLRVSIIFNVVEDLQEPGRLEFSQVEKPMLRVREVISTTQSNQFIISHLIN